MIDKLKTFVSKNREKFDSKEPKQDLWKKIDARMEVKNSSTISSNWLSKLKYFGLSASVLVVAIYFISENLNNSSAKELTQNGKDSAISNSEEWVKANKSNSAVKNESNKGNLNPNTEAGDQGSANKTANAILTKDTVRIKKDSVQNPKPNDNFISAQNKINPTAIVHPIPKEEDPNELMPNKEENLVGKNKANKIYIPAEPDKINMYTGTLYDGSLLCDILRVFKFPGQVVMDPGHQGGHNVKLTLRTMGCSRLENMTNMKAIWLKGKTDKEITLAIKDGFENILLVKSDGREFTPEAISHYYKGLGVITGYSGKHFDLIFKNKVEVILFFKNAEEGDKIVIDGIIEAVVKNKP